MTVGNFAIASWLLIELAKQSVITVAIIVSLQALVIALVAALLSRFCLRDAQCSHRIWLAAVGLLLIIVPVRGFHGGWPVEIASKASVEGAVLQDSDYSALAASETQLAPGTGDDLPSELFIQSSQRLLDAGSLQVVSSRQSARDEQLYSLAANATPAKAVIAEAPHAAEASIGLNFAKFLWRGYLLVCALALLRLGWNMWSLRVKTRSGTTLNDASRDVFSRAANSIGLGLLPTIKVVDGVSMPLTCGIFQPMVLLPGHFEDWSPAEQRAVALHELMHVKRRDVMCELLARVMRAVYWFHPASAFLSRQLTLTRELATDQAVVACGEEPHSYAKSVVDVLTRLHLQTHHLKSPTLPVIAMSAMGNLEIRLKNILDGKYYRRSLLRGRCFIGLLLVVAALTTLRIELVTAQTDLRSTNNANPKQGQVESPPKPKVGAADHDLISRMAHCEVLTVTGDEYDAEFDVSGQVLSPTGQPVEGAIVLLRESSTARISSEPRRYIEIPERHLVRVNDVFARTTTDRDGRFRFAGAKSPAMPKHWSNSWRGDVVAGHPQLGVGWTRLGAKRERHRVDSGMIVALRPSAVITGEYLAPDRTPLSGAVAYIYRCELPSNLRSFNDNDLDLQASQLTPRAMTDIDGEFSFSGIPQGCLATAVGADHGQWLGANAVIATGRDIPLGKLQQSGIYGIRDVDVLQSPVTLLADLGVEALGILSDDQGQAIQGANIWLASSVDRLVTDHRGHFSMRRKRESWKDVADQNDGKVKFVVLAPDGSNFISRYQDFPLEEVLEDKPIQLSMNRGVRVRGKVVTSEGLPMADVKVSQVATNDSIRSGDSTDEFGNYELVLSPGRHVLVFGTDSPGYQLPTGWASVYGKGAGAENMPRKMVDVSASRPTIELEPFEVQRSSPVKVVVLLPDGQPAVNATVILRGVDRSLEWPAQMQIAMQPLQDLSKAVDTDSMGRAELLSLGIPTTDAQVEATLVSGENSYRGEASLSNMNEGVLRIELANNWRLRGRVLLNGHPVVGASVAISESANSTGSEQARPGIRMAFHSQDVVVTDEEGRYQVAVRGDKTYSVSLQMIPGVVLDDTGVSHVASQVAEGVLEVRDLDYTSGIEEIAGLVLDEAGTPLKGASVTIPASSTWIGHHTESQTFTDAEGRFHLRKVPQGRHELRVSAPGVGRPRANPSVIDATTGDRQMRITLDTRPLPEIPRLHPKKIVDTSSDNERAASIGGRLMLDGEPMAGIKLGIVQEDRRRVTSVTAQETSTNDDGFFSFENLPPSRDYAIYTLLDQTAVCALPISLVQAPANGQVAELGDIETQSSESLKISVRTGDKSPLPAGGRIFVSRGKAWHSARLDIPHDGESQAEVSLPAVANELFEVSIRFPGYKVLRTLPYSNRDWNHRYPIRFNGPMTFIVVLTPDQ